MRLGVQKQNKIIYSSSCENDKYRYFSCLRFWWQANYLRFNVGVQFSYIFPINHTPLLYFKSFVCQKIEKQESLNLIHTQYCINWVYILHSLTCLSTIRSQLQTIRKYEHWAYQNFTCCIESVISVNLLFFVRTH